MMDAKIERTVAAAKALLAVSGESEGPLLMVSVNSYRDEANGESRIEVSLPIEAFRELFADGKYSVKRSGIFRDDYSVTVTAKKDNVLYIASVWRHDSDYKSLLQAALDSEIASLQAIAARGRR